MDCIKNMNNSELKRLYEQYLRMCSNKLHGTDEQPLRELLDTTQNAVVTVPIIICEEVARRCYKFLDENEAINVNKEMEILSITINSKIKILHDKEWKDYEIYNPESDSFDLRVIGNNNIVYGLSCCNIGELKAFLLADFYNKTINDIAVK